MLTHSSSRHVVCPMDEDVLPSHPFCSAPLPHSDPPAPLVPLSPSSTSLSGRYGETHSDSGSVREQSPSDRAAAQTRSPTRKRRQRQMTVALPAEKQPRAEKTHTADNCNLDSLGLTFMGERQTCHMSQRCPSKEPTAHIVTKDEHLAEAVVPNADDVGVFDGSTSREDTSVTKGWMITPLIQTFKSKMASFTEIVMSPVKLFKANSPPSFTTDIQDQCEHRCDTQQVSAEGLPACGREVQHESGSQDATLDRLSASTETRLGKLANEPNHQVDASLHPCTQELHEDSPTQDSPRAQEDSPMPFPHSPSNCSSLPRPPSSVLAPNVDVSASFILKKHKLFTGDQGKESKTEVVAQGRSGRPTAVGCVVPEVTVKDFPSMVNTPTDVNVSSHQVSNTNVLSTDIAAPYNGRTKTLLSVNAWNLKETGSCAASNQKVSENGVSVRKSLRQGSKPGGEKGQSLNVDMLPLVPNLDTSIATGFGKVKRKLQLGPCSQDITKKKRLPTGAIVAHTSDFVGTVSHDSVPKILRSTGSQIVQKTAENSEKGKAVSNRARGKGGQQTSETVTGTMPLATTEISKSDHMVKKSKKTSGCKQNNRNKNGPDSNTTKETCRPHKIKTKTSLQQGAEIVDGDINLEVIAEITSAKDTQEQPPFMDLHAVVQSVRCSRETQPLQTKPPKRKRSQQTMSVQDAENSSVPVIHKVEPLVSSPVKVKPRSARATTKRQKRDGRVVTKSCPSDTPEPPQSIHSADAANKTEGKTSDDAVFFETTPCEVVPPNTYNAGAHDHFYFRTAFENSCAESPPAAEDAIPVFEDKLCSGQSDNSGPQLPVSSRGVRKKPQRVNSKRRNFRLMHQANLADEVKTSVTVDDTSLSTSESSSSASCSLSRNLSRSYSCPEIPSLLRHDSHGGAQSPLHSRSHFWPQTVHVPPVPHAHRSLRRARRHTVCSLEVEREIAPLCLRKEVYPSRRPGHSPSLPMSPGASLSVLASCFLSSPLAFLSRRMESRGVANRSHVSSPASASSPFLSCPAMRPPRADACSDLASSSGNQLELPTDGQLRDEDNTEDSNSSSQFEDVGFREEKALSDSEIKVQKLEERGKVSSIRIRRTLPKPQANLTPMGLPKAIRPKKKEFSLEEIYTNKNFNKLPESRLETIFEMAPSRRNGSESWFGKRVKRFLEFPELGIPRKPKKPLVIAGKVHTSRPRRGSYQSSKQPVSTLDVDSLLCAALEQLDLWLESNEGSTRSC